MRHGDDQQRHAQRGGDDEVAAHRPLLVQLGLRLGLGASADITRAETGEDTCGTS